MKRIKSVKDLQRLPSGNFLDVKTRIVYDKSAIEREFGEELKELEKSKEVAKAVKPEAEVETEVKAEVKPKTKTKSKNSKQ